MLIYNTTYLVTDRQYGPWRKWLTEIHIPSMINSGFMNPQVAKILSVSEEQEGNSFAVQFNIQNMFQLQRWDEENAEVLLDDISRRFGTEVLSFSTIMEII